MSLDIAKRPLGQNNLQLRIDELKLNLSPQLTANATPTITTHTHKKNILKPCQSK
jgi:hypothetical protein